MSEILVIIILIFQLTFPRTLKDLNAFEWRWWRKRWQASSSPWDWHGKQLWVYTQKVLPVKMKRPLITQNNNSYENLLRLVMIENDGRWDSQSDQRYKKRTMNFPRVSLVIHPPDQVLHRVTKKDSAKIHFDDDIAFGWWWWSYVCLSCLIYQ